MKKFLTLTNAYNQSMSIMVSIDNIVSIEQDNTDPDDSRIIMDNGSKYLVVESLDDIKSDLKLISEGVIHG